MVFFDRDLTLHGKDGSITKIPCHDGHDRG